MPCWATHLPHPFPCVAKGRSPFLLMTLSHIRVFACAPVSSWKGFPFIFCAWPQPFYPLNLNWNAVLDHPVRFFYHFLSQLIFFSFIALITFWNYCIHFTVFPFHSNICSVKARTQLSCWQFYLQSWTQSLIYSYSSINTCWMNKRINEKHLLTFWW